jgi:hypothetical protein
VTRFAALSLKSIKAANAVPDPAAAAAMKKTNRGSKAPQRAALHFTKASSISFRSIRRAKS